MLTAIDKYLLGKAQKIADRFSALTGLTKFWLEKWFFILSHVSFASYVVLSSISKYDTFPYFIISILLGNVILGVQGIEKREDAFLNSDKLIFAPESQPQFRKPFFMFVALIVVFVTLTHDWINSPLLFMVTAFLLLVITLYLSACVPRRPSKSLLREWYEKTLWRINNALAPVGEGG